MPRVENPICSYVVPHAAPPGDLLSAAAGQKGPPKLPFSMKYGNPKDTPLQVKVPGGDYNFNLKK